MSTMMEFQKATLVRAADVTAGILSGALCNLYQSPIDINQGTLLATFDDAVATYNTYLPQPIVWGAPSVSGDGIVESVSIPLLFTPTDAVIPNALWGLYVTDSGGTLLYFAGQFDGAPLGFNSALDILYVTFRFRPATNSIVVQLN